MSKEGFLKSLKKFLIILGLAIFFVFVVFGVLRLSSFLDKYGLEKKPIVKDYTVNQLVPAVPGEPVKWVKTVNLDEIDGVV